MLVISFAYDQRYRGTWWSHRRGRCWRRDPYGYQCRKYSKFMSYLPRDVYAQQYAQSNPQTFELNQTVP